MYMYIRYSIEGPEVGSVPLTVAALPCCMASKTHCRNKVTERHSPETQNSLPPSAEDRAREPPVPMHPST